ncbi:MAG TPA: helix-turn-helix transcriptional regulator [Caulobacteraceae bacterium]|nr:helix-turn-helix transcriptional regulator [Caulobacteraceae bacterium]
MPEQPVEPDKTRSLLIAEGQGWRAAEVVCLAGPADRPFEEQHAWTSVAAVLDGVFTYRSHRGRALMTPGSLLLGEGGTCFHCGHEHSTGDRCVAFHFGPDLVDETLSGFPERRASRFAAPNLPPLERLLPLLSRARTLAASRDPLEAEDLALGMARAAFAVDGEMASRMPTAREEAKAAEAVRIIDAASADPLTVEGLAAAVGLGRQRFALAFRRTVGVTPYNYVLRRRLEAAAERLRAGPEPVLAVALDVGFGDLSEFTRRFRRHFGVSPGAWRRKL